MSHTGLAVSVYQRNGKAYVDGYYYQGRMMTHEETVACSLPPVGHMIADFEDVLSKGFKNSEEILDCMRRRKHGSKR